MRVREYCSKRCARLQVLDLSAMTLWDMAINWPSALDNSRGQGQYTHTPALLPLENGHAALRVSYMVHAMCM